MLPIQFPAPAFDYFDVIAVAWLIIGLFCGRKRGMTQEVLPALQWVGIVVVSGLWYKPFARLLLQYTQSDPLWCRVFDPLTSNLTAYFVIGFGVHIVYVWLKKLLGEKLVGSDLFGRGEYYLGMAAGTVRFACMLIAFCALMNARIITPAELAASKAALTKDFEGVPPPTFGTIQQSILFCSYTGQFVRANLMPVLIVTQPFAAPKKNKSLAQRDLDEILDSSKTHVEPKSR